MVILYNEHPPKGGRKLQSNTLMTRINGYLGRRHLLKLAGIGGVGVAATGAVLWSRQKAVNSQLAVAQGEPTDFKPVSGDEALKKLLDGNKRFVQDKREYPDQSRGRLRSVATAQHPFATILSCADSRVPAEIITDRGLGDLFVVRIAGNVISPYVIGSLEFSVVELGVQLIMILGHERCGAVSAAVKGEPLPGRIGTFVEDIKPAVESVRNKPGNLVENTVVANVQFQVKSLLESSVMLAQMVREGKLKVVGGRYDLDTGEVTIVT